MTLENTVQKQRGRPFTPGHSGNAAGRPKGARNRSTLAAEALLEGEAEALTRKAVELALAGDTMALRLCIERILPPRKDRPITFELPLIDSNVEPSEVFAAVLSAVASGKITPSEAFTVTALVDAHRRATEDNSPEMLPGTDTQIRLSFMVPEAGELK